MLVCISKKKDPGFNFSRPADSLLLAELFLAGPIRESLINSFVCEFEVEGTILATTNQDRPGMVGVLGTCLGKNRPVSTVKFDLPDSVVEEIRKQEGINPFVKSFCNEFQAILMQTSCGVCLEQI